MSDLKKSNNIVLYNEINKRTNKIPKQIVINEELALKAFETFYQGETKFVYVDGKKMAVTINTRMQDLMFIYVQ